MDEDAVDVKPYVDANTAQLRVEHMHANRLLTEHYLDCIKQLELERERVRTEGEKKLDEAKGEYEELSAQIEELTRKKEELEYEVEAQEDWEEEKERLEDELQRLKEGRESRYEGLKTWIKTEEKLRTEILELKKRKKSLVRKYDRLQASTREDLAKHQEELRIANASIEEWRNKYTAAMEEKIDIIHRFAVR